MLVFLAVAVFFMLRIQEDQRELESVAVLYEQLQTGLYQELQDEFSQDLQYWNAEIDSISLAVRFREPEVLFAPGEAILEPEFQEILIDFFPRYLDVLMGDGYRDHIEEVRIEGHTSSDWLGLEGLPAYEANMRLSQERTRSVLNFVVRLPRVQSAWEGWLRERLTANGLSSSRLVVTEGREDRERSRRVEFRVRTDADAQMDSILRGIRGPA